MNGWTISSILLNFEKCWWEAGIIKPLIDIITLRGLVATMSALKHSNKHIALVFPVLICRAYDYDE